MLTREEIQVIITKTALLNDIDITSDMNNFRYALDNKDFMQIKGHNVEEVYTKGGGEDEGSEHWTVLKVSKGEKVAFIRYTGWYASYDGAYLDNLNFDIVVAKPVAATEWVSV